MRMSPTYSELLTQAIVVLYDAEPRLKDLTHEVVRRGVRFEAQLRLLVGPGRPDNHPVLSHPVALKTVRRVLRPLAQAARLIAAKEAHRGT